MKTTMTLLGLLSIGFASAQTWKVGVNTEVPKETLEVKGTLRVDEMPEHTTGKIYDGAESKTATFTGTRMLVGDNNGNVGYLPYMAAPVALVGVDGVDAFPRTTVNLPAADGINGSISRKVVREVSFTLDRKSMVFINVSLSATVVKEAEGETEGTRLTPLTKRLGMSTALNGKTILTNGIPFLPGERTEISPGTFARGYVGGIFSLSNHRAMILEPGTHTLKIEAVTMISKYDNKDFGVDYGASSADILDVIAYPMP